MVSDMTQFKYPMTLYTFLPCSTCFKILNTYLLSDKAQIILINDDASGTPQFFHT